MKGLAWAEDVVDVLLELRKDGVTDFGEAWVRSTTVAGRPKCDDEFAAFFRLACKREWEGHVRADFAGLAELLVGDTNTLPRRPLQRSSQAVALLG